MEKYQPWKNSFNFICKARANLAGTSGARSVWPTSELIFHLLWQTAGHPSKPLVHICQASVTSKLEAELATPSTRRGLRRSWQPSNPGDFWHVSDNLSNPWDFRHISGNASFRQGSLHMVHLDLATRQPPRTAGSRLVQRMELATRQDWSLYAIACLAFWNLHKAAITTKWHPWRA